MEAAAQEGGQSLASRRFQHGRDTFEMRGGRALEMRGGGATGVVKTPWLLLSGHHKGWCYQDTRDVCDETWLRT